MSYVIIDNQLVKVEDKKKKKKEKRLSQKKMKRMSQKKVKSSRKEEKKKEKELFLSARDNNVGGKKLSGRSKRKKLERAKSTVAKKGFLNNSSHEDGSSDVVYVKYKKGHKFSQEEVDDMDDELVEMSFLDKLNGLRMASDLVRVVSVEDMKAYLVGTLDLDHGKDQLEVHLKVLEKMLDKNTPNYDQLVALRNYVSTISPIWLYEFTDKAGIDLLVDVHKLALSRSEIEPILECCRIIRLMLTVSNSPYNVFSHVFSVDGVTKNIVTSLAYMNEISKADMMRVLSALASSDRNFWRKVFDEFYVLGFDLLVDPVLESYNHNVELSTMTLINTLMRGFTEEQQAFFIEVDDRLGDMTKLEESSKSVVELQDEVQKYKAMRDEFSPMNNSSKQKLQEEQLDILRNRVAKQKREIQRLKNLVRDAEELIAEQQAAAIIGGAMPGVQLNVNAPKKKESKIKIFGKKKRKDDVDTPAPVQTIPVPASIVVPAAILPPPPPMMGGMGLPPPPPPPPGMGGIPPPPGMGGNIGGLPAKPVIKPGKKMRALNWSKIHPSKIKNTIWEKASDENIVVEAKVLESFFGTDPFTKPIKGEEADTKKKMEKPQKISLLPPKKATNVEIMLKGLKRDAEDISKNLLRLPPGCFTIDELEAVQNNLPEPEEAAALKTYTGEEDMLAPGDQYFLTLLTIPFLNSRVQSMLYQFNFEDTVEVIRRKTTIISGAIDTLANDERLVQFLEVTLAVGNYMNGGTNRGGVYGFKLSSLPKLIDVRAIENSKFTLLHYLINYVSERDRELVEYFFEFDDIHLATKDNLDDIKNDLKKLLVGIKPIISSLEDPKCDKYFKRALGSWIPHAQEVCDEIENFFLRTEEDYTKLINSFGENGAKSNVFFTMMSTFGKQVEKCVQENIENKDRDERERARRERMGNTKGPQMVAVSENELAGILGTMKHHDDS